MTRILLIGVTGQVGLELWKSLASVGEVIPASRNGGTNILKVDLAQPDTLRSTIRDMKPNLIVNAAAYTSVDEAEHSADAAMLVNGIAPGVMAEEAKLIGASIVHYSTDYVFDGTKKLPYIETDGTNPLNVYGKTKLVGEQAIQSIEVPQFIFRTSWVYGLRRKNFLLTMLKLAQEKETLKVVDDQIGSPTWSSTIAQLTAQILLQAEGDVPNFMATKSGIYHLSSTGQTSWYGFAKKIFELTDGIEQRMLKSVLPICSDFYPSPVVRPSYSLLDVGMLTRTFGLHVPKWDKALVTALGEMTL
jgi:dTDP-4-dehydrorhamnose reductase